MSNPATQPQETKSETLRRANIKQQLARLARILQLEQQTEPSYAVCTLRSVLPRRVTLTRETSIPSAPHTVPSSPSQGTSDDRVRHSQRKIGRLETSVSREEWPQRRLDVEEGPLRNPGLSCESKDEEQRESANNRGLVRPRAREQKAR